MDTPPAPPHHPGDLYAETIAQVLAAVDGNHAWMMPVYDPGGELIDFRIEATSASAHDSSGRRGDELISMRIRQMYSHTVDGSIWQAYRDTFLDGKPHTLGPFPYAGPVTTVPASMQVMLSLRRTGPGLLVSWVYSTDSDQLTERIAHTERLGNLGWSQHDLITGTATWSDQLYRIYGRDPAAGPPSNAESDAITVAEDRPIRHQIAERLARGEPADATYRIQTPHGVRHIRVVADTVKDVNGRPLRAYGIVQDLTSQVATRNKIAQVQQQLQARQEDLAAEHRLASHLQEIILPIPVTPVDLPGLRVAVRYLPAEQADRIGGDWYHASTGHDGSVVLAIGDVAGHGLPAAAAMAQMRHAFAALSYTTTTDPATLLAHLNRLLFVGDDPQSLASAIAARYQPADRTLQWAQAGHPAPLLTRGGRTRELARPTGPLLGAIADATFGTARTTIRDGDLLVFYTDGLVERRNRSLDDGLRKVIAVLNQLSAHASPQPLADLLARLDHTSPDDDTCVLAIRAIPLAVPATVTNRDRAAITVETAGSPAQ